MAKLIKFYVDDSVHRKLRLDKGSLNWDAYFIAKCLKTPRQEEKR